MRSAFFDRLALGTPILFDGGMGTQLYARGVPYERCFDELNLLQPDLVQAVHRAYIAAGAEVIETNTFAANRFRLAAYRLEGRVRDINFRAVKIAREAREVSGEPVFLAGSVSSIGHPIAPVGTVSAHEAGEIFVEQIEALLEAGIDLLVLETFSSLIELREAVLAARSVSADLPIIAEVSVDEEANTLAGASPAEVVELLDALEVDVLGVNCGVGPQAALAAVQQMRPLTTTLLSAMPNAGFPTTQGGRQIYVSTPEYFAEYARRFAEAGVSVIGGCCGTTPAHIVAMRSALASMRAAPVQIETPHPDRAFVDAALPHAVQPGRDSAAEISSPLAHKVRSGQFIISVEVDPPRGITPNKMLQGAALVKQAGVDCVDIGDSPMARVRMSCIAFAALCEQRVGVETLIHFTTRDRNLMALQSELLGAHALGIRNVIALTGDPPQMGSYPSATGVWDVKSPGFIRVIKQLNQGVDWAGNSIGKPTDFLVACAVNPMADDLEYELDWYHQKVEAGADFAITQPLYDLEQLDRFFSRVPNPPIPTVVEIMPLQSYKHAEFCHNELAGVVIPEHHLTRMKEAGERGMDVGFELAHQFLLDVFDRVNGVLLVPSFHRYEMVAELVRETVRLRDRVRAGAFSAPVHFTDGRRR
ncbi:MAG: bifunctional homocysteine S-methyltransferase/methylenetetrahydrofolate reductase [Chloroflexota bacterium]|nr:bifunctional homocysteine S-methyltransferase/methylenetetrahydrofolate reductase [Chloroflexota bacterium]